MILSILWCVASGIVRRSRAGQTSTELDAMFLRPAYSDLFSDDLRFTFHDLYTMAEFSDISISFHQLTPHSS